MMDEKVVGMTAAYWPLLAESLARPGAEWRGRVFAGVAAQVPEARAFVARALAGCPGREAMMLCVSELCANAIQHTASGAGGAFIVEVTRTDDGVACIAVTDAGSGDWVVPEPRCPSAGADVAQLAECGRGLALVAACSSRWGYEKAPAPAPGYTVWAEATWPVSVEAGCISKRAIRGSKVAAAPGGGLV
jgi:serine/threonine-protein kinase RsbW